MASGTWLFQANLRERLHFSSFWPLAGLPSETIMEHLYYIYLTCFLEMSTTSHHGWASWGQLLVWIYLWATPKQHHNLSDLWTSKVKRKAWVSFFVLRKMTVSFLPLATPRVWGQFALSSLGCALAWSLVLQQWPVQVSGKGCILLQRASLQLQVVLFYGYCLEIRLYCSFSFSLLLFSPCFQICWS